ncbi:MAG: hypothetical protein ACE5H4_04785 [Candidatus Thorarchaeota archaeon]
MDVISVPPGHTVLRRTDDIVVPEEHWPIILPMTGILVILAMFLTLGSVFFRRCTDHNGRAITKVHLFRTDIASELTSEKGSFWPSTGLD